MIATRTERETFVASIIRACPRASVRHCTRLFYLGNTHGILAAIETQRELSGRELVKKQRVRDKITAICKQISCRPVFKENPAEPTVVIVAGAQALQLPTSTGEMVDPDLYLSKIG